MDAKPTVALSIRQPWAWLILCGLPMAKDIENRCRRTHFRGRTYVHASLGMTHAEYEDAVAFALRFAPHIIIPDMEDLPKGGLVGEVDIVDCVDCSLSKWFVGEYGYVLANPLRYDKIIPCKAALGFFKPQP